MNRILTVAVTVSLLAAAASAQILPSVGADAALMSKYVWRGLVATDGPVLQPCGTVGLSGVTFGAWANLDLDDANLRSGEITEVDLWAEYGLGVGPAAVSLGLLHYGYPDAEGDTTELYAVGSLGLVPFCPTLSLFKDVDAVEGFYANLAIGHGLAVTPTETVDLSASLGLGDGKHNQAYYAGADGGGADLTLGASWTWRALPKISVTPSVLWTTLIGDASDRMDAAGAETTAVVFGATASFTF